MTSIVRVNVSSTNYEFAAGQISDWARARESRFVCAANVHMIMEAFDSPKFLQLISRADLVTPDGMPLVWIMRLKGQPRQERVYGPTLMLHVLERAVQADIPVGFYGGEPEIIKRLVKRMGDRFPSLKVVYAFSPPYRKLSVDEDAEIIRKINDSGAQILFIGLGCPKQEIWMAEHRGRIRAVMLGVGAAFDFHAGAKSQAPLWLQKIGMEWFYRFLTEPRRLWRRYLCHNPRFIFLAIADLLGFFRYH